MANWCNNIVMFTGEPRKLEEMEQLFQAMASREKETGRGQLPPFIQSDDGYLFDIYLEEGTLYYDTRWVPNTNILVQTADHFKAGFVHMYSEFAMGIFGEANYGQGILTDSRLDYEDFSRFEYDESGVYLFEGQTYETDMEILELLLERKKTGPDSPRGLTR
ncbi:hypothetical protein ACS126_06475 [Sphingobacterium lactis]|uniref:DUF1281 family ferredoxin-like fold protein n=1 Tax=Sphingobacterium TaxID=28453 RepID=UPI00289B4B93|nr:hypothetical protein [Sphingobacterium multivorum]